MQTASIVNQDTDEEEQYEALLKRMRADFPKEGALFTTDASDLFETFLIGFPKDRRQHYNCHSCRNFIERFGGLVSLDEEGQPSPVMWSFDAPLFFKKSIEALHKKVYRAKVTGVFLSEEAVLGTPTNTCPKFPGRWNHVSVTLPQTFKKVILTASQVMAEKKADFGMLQRGLAEFSIDVVKQAYALLTSGNLYRSEKCIDVAKWLLDLHSTRDKRGNVLWRAVAAAPAGFCHVRSTMIGTLLEDIQAGLAFDDIKRKFDAKMSPIEYQRPTSAPTAGQIAQAEKIVQELSSAGALKRRFATLEDVVSHALWTPKVVNGSPKGNGVFSHLKPKSDNGVVEVEQPAVTLTWEKFRRTILPTAESIEFRTNHSRDGYTAMVTAADPSAPLIFQWDNPVSWYCYHNGSYASAWNLQQGAFTKVNAVILSPSMWTDENKLAHQGQHVCFILDGAKDNEYKFGAAFFPGCLRNEYHGVRKTMEAYAASSVIEGKEESSACGIALGKNGKGSHLFRVTTNGIRTSYVIDRWD